MIVTVDDQILEPSLSGMRKRGIGRGNHTFTTRTANGVLIESFEAEVGNSGKTWVYNIAGASPLVVWTAVYGDAPQLPPR